MIPISDETKKVYEKDVVPGFITILIGDQLYPAETLYPAEDLYPKGGQFDENGWVEGSLSITEALCSKETLDYKSVEANKMEVELASEEGNKNEFNGLAVQVSQTVNAEVIPLGSFTVSNTEREGDYYTKITAYDDMKKFIDTDVTDWWNTGVTFPITIRNLLLSLCKQVGVEQALPDSWTNSDVEIKQNTYADSVTGSDILGMIQEACGLFFHTNRKNQLVVITGATDETEFKHTAIYEDPTIAEYTIPGITGVQIKSTDDDIGTLYGEKTTVYQVTGNYLLLDKTDEERKTIAKGILANIGGKPYKPFSAKVKARNYIECGDPIKITTYNGNTSSFMLLSRTMTEQGLITDEIEVKGKANTVNNPRSNSKKIETLNKRAHEITETLDEYSSRFTDIETEQTEQGKKITETQSQIKQTADEINLSVSKSITETKAYADNVANTAESNAKSDTADKLKSYSTTTEMNSAIRQTVDEINLSVSKTYTSKDELGNTLTSYTKKAEIIATINNDTSNVKISADKLSLVFGNTPGQQITASSINTSSVSNYGDGVKFDGNGQIGFSSSRRIGLWNYWDTAHNTRANIAVLSVENSTASLGLYNYDSSGNLRNRMFMQAGPDDQWTYINNYDSSEVLKGRLYIGSDMTFIAAGSAAKDANVRAAPAYTGLFIGNMPKVAATSTATDLNGEHLHLFGGSRAHGDSFSLGITGDGRVTAFNGANVGYTVVSTGVSGGDGNHPITFGWNSSKLICWVDTNQVWSTSDARAKKNVKTIEDDYLEAVGEVDLKEFNFKTKPYDPDVLHFGVVAQNIILHLKRHNLSADKLGMVYRVGKPGVEEDELAGTYCVDKEEFLIARVAYDEKRIAALEEKLKEVTA